MTVQSAARTVTVPRQAESVEPPPAPPAPPPALLRRDRSLTADERLFVIATAAMFSALATFIVTFLLVGEHVWS